MQEFRRDGSDVLTQNASMEDVRRALQNEKNLRVELHLPGSIISRLVDGLPRKYRVEPDGSLARLNVRTLEPIDVVK